MKTEDIYRLLINQKFNLTTDTRNIKDGDIFFALKGDNFNGNRFAEQALKSGCSFAVVDEKPDLNDDRLIVVEDVLTMLQKLANMHRRNLNIPILAITGSNGKTTTKELIASVLSKKYKIGFTKGNLNNHIGVPLTLLSFTTDLEFAIVEMGANHPGEIKELCEIAEPDYGIITNIGKAHIEGFGSLEGVIKAKSELYDYLNMIKASIFYNSDNTILSDLQKVSSISFGVQPNNEFYGSIIDRSPYLKVEICDFNKERYTINTNLFGDYNLENIVAASCIGSYFGVSKEMIAIAINEYQPTNNRSQLLKTSKNTLYLDAYNANPSSMKAALENFISISGDKAVILGDMLELGAVSDEEHYSIIELIQRLKLDHVYLVGECFNKVGSPSFHSFENTDDLISFLKANSIVNKHILIKGSRGIRLEKVIDVL